MRVAAKVDATALVVRAGNSAWPFSIDRGGASVTINFDGVAYCVRPQSWREKVRLARFARLGEAFLQASFLECCVADGVPARVEPEHKEALLALVLWINLPDDESAGLPLDTDQLARVTIAVCRAMNVGPLAIAELSAPEVESLWRNLDREAGPDEINQRRIAEETFDTRIVVLPDAAAAEEAERAGAPAGAMSLPGVAESLPSSSAGPAEAPFQAAQFSPPENAEVTEIHLQKAKAAEPARPEARFRVSFTNAAERPLASPRAGGKFSQAPSSAATVAAPSAESLNGAKKSATAAVLREGDLSRRGGALAAAQRECFAPDAAQPVQSAAACTATPGAPDSAPFLVARTAPISSLLDEFCERLDEAAADLGIVEEV
jgi:hypothetical protein